MSTPTSPSLQDSVMFERPLGFAYKEGELYCERVPLSRLPEDYAPRLYVYSPPTMREGYKTLDHAFKNVERMISYSVKANSNLSILRFLARLGSGFDIVSGGELQGVRLARKKAVAKIVFSGVGKTEDELVAALRGGILLFNVESEGELELLARCAKDLEMPARVAFRVNPDVSAETHPYISTGLREHKFGVPISTARELYQQAAKHEYLNVSGVSLHIGSQITDLTPFRLAMERIAELIEQLSADGHQIEFVDAGGGPRSSCNRNEPVDFEQLAQRYAEAILQPLESVP